MKILLKSVQLLINKDFSVELLNYSKKMKLMYSSQ